MWSSKFQCTVKYRFIFVQSRRKINIAVLVRLLGMCWDKWAERCEVSDETPLTHTHTTHTPATDPGYGLNPDARSVIG